ncbi:Glycine betaine-binding protein OpuAC [Lentibacillus sp. JNUCC-1]|uniref:glycine betaine ABC transporter substrate-binding protein n=1 Tax=Lentibacillus sp. JNUCC-1 TaxID=2654513 RepID=UPI0012E94DA2|nr:glycine betaine ABC transporter substrate-binding protein [Lentibacillus sp. JNUCC-1]MUV36373.1 Glycine betaine-binding protein OpuAC [Lentibacillus sp. JNUCC-1]
MMMVVGIAILFTGCSDNNENSGEEAGDKGSEEKSTIKIGLDPYDYATVPAYLSAVILENEGFEVDIKEAEVGILYQALSSQDIDAFIDIWRPNLHSEYIEEYDDSFETAGKLFSDMPLGMGVPTYMEDINSIEDLREHADEFDHTIYSIEPGSGMGKTTEVMVEDYEMDDFEISNSSVAGMMAQMKKLIEKEEPIAFNAWRPHPMFVNYDIKFLEDPRNSWKLDDVEVGVTPQLEEEAPTAYTLFSNMELDLDMVEEWLISLDEGEKPRDLAEAWIEEHQDTVDEWLGK